jgi:hypothetical protein
MFKSSYRRKREGFSLIAALIVGLVGLAIVGAVFHLTTSGVGMGRSSSNANARYNLLGSAIEKVRESMKEMFESPTNDPPRRMTSGSSIEKADDLLIESADVTILNQSELARYGISGKNGELTVRIYDILYEASEVSSSISGDAISSLPQSLPLSASGVSGGAGPGDPGSIPGLPGVPDNAGSYLIKTSLKVDGADAGSLAVALVLSNKE